MTVLVCLLALPAQASAVDFHVNDLGDAGDNTCDASCTLRDAIDDANATAGGDEVHFDVTGTISPASTLSVTQPLLIDGTTAPGYDSDNPPLIALDGNAAPIAGISVTAGGSTVRALSIYEYGTSQVDLINPGSAVESSWIGVRPNGTTDPTTGRGIRAAGDNQVIGGTTANTGNLIAGTATAGIDVINGAQFVQIRRNRIGTNAAGTAASTDNGSWGIFLTNADNTIIGGSTADGNVVSGFLDTGVHIGGAGNSGTTVSGNLIGTNAAGTAAIPNLFGVALAGPDTRIGGVTPSLRNVISGNTAAGISFANAGVNHDGTKLYGNYIGTNAAGTGPVANGTGVSVTDGGSALTPGPKIGETGSGQGNVISGNTNAGIEFQAGGEDREFVTVSNNLIGLAANGTTALGNGAAGVDIDGTGSDNSENNQVSFNTIAGNGTSGVRVRGTSTDNAIQGNLIGIDTGGANDGNIGPGVSIEGAAGGNQIGGVGTGQGNDIAFNGGGISIAGTGTGNSVRGNAIRTNLFLGIAFNGGTSPFANDPLDADTGANGLKNHPVITSATKTNSGAVVLQGSLDTTAGTQELDAYWSPACDSSGSGEGANYIGSGTVGTTGTGSQPGGFTVSSPLSSPPLGAAITVTATGASGTSEFSPCHTLTAAPAGGGGGPPPAGSSQAPKPTVAKTTNVGRVSGKVLVKLRGSSKFVELRGDQLIPVGSQVDTRRGRARVSVEVESAKVQSAVFYDGVFKINQKKAAKPVAEMQLVGKLENCAKKSKRASASARKRRGRRLWGKGKGRFRTKGKRSSALVRGTTWLVEDRCDGSTLTRVTEGTVTVRDFRRRKNVTVKKGKRYVAKPRGKLR